MTEPMITHSRSRVFLAAALVAVLVGYVAGGASGASSRSTSTPRDAATAASLPAWGSEPVPQFGSGRSSLHAVSVPSATSGWAVGVIGMSSSESARPLVERWDGASWSVVDVPDITGAELYGVVEVSRDDVWMVGTFNNSYEALVLHWDGSAVSRVANPNPGANRNDLFAVSAVG